MRSLLLVALSMLVLAGCDSGPRYKSGDKVWLDLDAPASQLDGFAEATVVEIKEKIVLVRIDDIKINDAHDAARGFEVGRTTFVDIDRLIPLQEGRTAFEERSSVLDGLAEFIQSPERYSQESASLLRSLAKKNNMTEALLTLDVLDEVGKMFSDFMEGTLFTTSTPTRFTNTYNSLRKTLLRYPNAYEAARTSQGQFNDVGISGAELAAVIINNIHGTLSEFELQLKEPKLIVDILEIIDAEDRAYHTFISDNGRLPVEGQNVDHFVQSRFIERRDRLAQSIGTDLVARLESSSFSSIEEARVHLRNAAEEVSDLASKLQREIPPLPIERRYLDWVELSITHREELLKIKANLVAICQRFYENQSEWAGKSRLIGVVRSQVKLEDATRATAHVEYQWRLNDGRTGTDRRTFTLQRVENGHWLATGMGDHMSARF